MKKKSLYLKLELDGYQEDQIVAHSISQSYKRLKSSKDPHEWPADRDTLLKAFKRIYYYYTGKNLK